MKEVLNVIVKNLVDYPDDVIISEFEDCDFLHLEVSVNSSDMGKIIGKQGKIANSIRTVVKSYANYKGKKVNIKII